MDNNSITKLSLQNLKCFAIRSFKTLNPGMEFLDNWHIDLIVRHLNAISEGDIKRLIINIPPRALKSTLVSVIWPAWILAMDPTKRIIVASYSMALSQKHSQECRQILQSKWYRDEFPETRILTGNNTKSKFLTTQNGFRFATSIGGTLTGEGADILIVDDPITPMQAATEIAREQAIHWFEQTFSSRLNNKRKGAIVLVMQRLHKDDLAGHLLKKRSWHHLNLPAMTERDILYAIGDFKYLRKAGEPLDPKREDIPELEIAREEIGSYGFNAQYLQKPVQIDGGLIKACWVIKESLPASFDAVYQSWDCAVKHGRKNDYSVCTTWGVWNNKYYLIDMLRKKLEFPELRASFLQLAKQYGPDGILVEDKVSGQALIQDMKANTFLPIIGIMPTSDKAVRAMSVSPLFESGKIVVNSSATWITEFELELTNFPDTEHDDIVDSVTQFLKWISGAGNSQIKIRNFENIFTE